MTKSCQRPVCRLDGLKGGGPKSVHLAVSLGHVNAMEMVTALNVLLGPTGQPQSVMHWCEGQVGVEGAVLLALAAALPCGGSLIRISLLRGTCMCSGMMWYDAAQGELGLLGERKRLSCLARCFGRLDGG